MKVWGDGGGVVGRKDEKGGGENSGEDKRGKGHGEGEECLIVGTQGCDAEACFENGGRCKLGSRVRTLCYPHVLDREGKAVLMQRWGDGKTGMGKEQGKSGFADLLELEDPEYDEHLEEALPGSV